MTADCAPAAWQAELKALGDKAEMEKRIEQKRAGASFRIQDINDRNREFQQRIERKVGEQTRRQVTDAGLRPDCAPSAPCGRLGWATGWCTSAPGPCAP